MGALRADTGCDAVSFLPPIDSTPHGAAEALHEKAQVRQGLDARAPERSLRPGGQAPRLPVARGVQADRTRRARQAAAPRHDAPSTWAPRPAAGRRCCASAWARRAGSSRSTCCRWTAIAGRDLHPGRTSARTTACARWTRRSAKSRADLVVSDMAPNLSGIDSADQARSVHLGELALDFAVGHLRPGGDLRGQGVPGRGASRSSSARWAGISPRSTCASPRRRAIAAARCFWSARVFTPEIVVCRRQAEIAAVSAVFSNFGAHPAVGHAADAGLPATDIAAKIAVLPTRRMTPGSECRRAACRIHARSARSLVLNNLLKNIGIWAVILSWC